MSHCFRFGRFPLFSSFFFVAGLVAPSAQAQDSNVQASNGKVKNGTFAVTLQPKAKALVIEPGELLFDHAVVVDCQCKQTDNFTVTGKTFKPARWQVLLFGTVSVSKTCPPTEIAVKGDLADSTTAKSFEVKGVLKKAKSGSWNGTLNPTKAPPEGNISLILRDIEFSQTSGLCPQPTAVPTPSPTPTRGPVSPTPTPVFNPGGDGIGGKFGGGGDGKDLFDKFKKGNK